MDQHCYEMLSKKLPNFIDNIWTFVVYSSGSYVVGQNYRVGTLWSEARSQPGLYKKTWKANRQTHSSARHSDTCLDSQNSEEWDEGITASSKPARQNNETLSQTNNKSPTTTTKTNPTTQWKQVKERCGSCARLTWWRWDFPWAFVLLSHNFLSKPPL